MNFLLLAGFPQIKKSTFGRLRDSRKSKKALLGVCGVPANRKKHFWAFAGFPQAKKKRFGICGSSAGHFQNLIGHKKISGRAIHQCSLGDFLVSRGKGMPYAPRPFLYSVNSKGGGGILDARPGDLHPLPLGLVPDGVHLGQRHVLERAAAADGLLL